MMVDYWFLGMAFVILVVIQMFWALDLLLAEYRQWQGWRALGRSGSLWLACFNLTTSILHGYFVLISFREPLKQAGGGVAIVVLAMGLTAALAWYWLPREEEENEGER